MRALGIGKIVVTPMDTGWSFVGDGNLAGMVGCTRVASWLPPSPPPVLLAGAITR
jgi:hypothetical protein